MEGDDDEGRKKKVFQGLGNSGSGSLRRSKRLMKNEDVKQQLEFHLDYVSMSSGNVSVEEIEEEERKGVKEEGERLGNEGGECVNENRKYSAEEKGKGKLSTDGSWLSMSIEEKMVPEEGETAGNAAEEEEMMPEDGNAAAVGSGTISDHEMAVNGLMHIWNWSREYEAKQRLIERVRRRARYRRDRNRWDKQRIAEIAPTFA
ncbi:hypothetical protein MKW98_029329 [Papaver atlanticum]|uniref:Uncharacterized protein n=1 Tax=Papaver atlanticum TaxID=357466 RepID=A0AAD4SHX4_9MAGN|nr:hypothetical protein MKW98_029329 [Papaver atlanticum]